LPRQLRQQPSHRSLVWLVQRGVHLRGEGAAGRLMAAAGARHARHPAAAAGATSATSAHLVHQEHRRVGAHSRSCQQQRQRHKRALAAGELAQRLAPAAAAAAPVTKHGAGGWVAAGRVQLQLLQQGGAGRGKVSRPGPSAGCWRQTAGPATLRSGSPPQVSPVPLQP
jgi:hypothetical protein